MPEQLPLFPTESSASNTKPLDNLTLTLRNTVATLIENSIRDLTSTTAGAAQLGARIADAATLVLADPALTTEAKASELRKLEGVFSCAKEWVAIQANQSLWPHLQIALSATFQSIASLAPMVVAAYLGVPVAPLPVKQA